MTPASSRKPWIRWAGEFAVIVVSVYVAIFFENWNQDRVARETARVALGQLLGELREDLADFERIVATQAELAGDYQNLDRWLTDPRSYPADSVGAVLLRLGTENPTLFPRRASWRTMVSSGQLADLEAPALVQQLGQLYENIYSRIDYNSRFYDEELNAALRAAPWIQWGRLPGGAIADDPQEVQRLALSLGRVQVLWNSWYRELLDDYDEDVRAAIAAVEHYLEGEGA